ncbi:MAG: nucleotidyltransferase family protein [Desulfobacterales bacterium]|jgi:molybdenum cofactor cytidylyltransferase
MSSQAQTAGIILAAGSSVRFGRTKQLIKLRDRYLVEWVLDAALDSRLQTVVLVLGHEHPKIIKAVGAHLDHPKLEVVINHRYREGQSTSLKTGLSCVRQVFSSVMYLLADQPMIQSSTIDLLLDQFHNSDKDICVPVFKRQRGNPTIFKRPVYEKIMMIEGDMGARQIIRENAEGVLYVGIQDPLCFVDIDSQEDLENLLALLP